MSVVVIFLNEERHLREAVESVFRQTFTDWELILVDDGSTDSSGEIARAFATDHPDRVQYVTHPGGSNLGLSASRNLGLATATGRYVAYLDGDDVWLPEKLERQLELFDGHDGVRLVYGPLRRWFSWTGRPEDQDKDDLYGIWGDRFELEVGRRYRPPELAALMIEHKDVVPAGALFERSLFDEVGGAPDSFTTRFEDVVVMFKMTLRADAFCADDSWYLYRIDERRPRDPAQRASTRLEFVEFAAEYLASNGIEDPTLTRAIRRARRQILHPRRHRGLRKLEAGLRRVRSAVTAPS